MKVVPVKTDPIAIIAAMQERSKKKDRPLTAANVVKFPLWPEPTRGTPNAWLRGALFAAIQGKERKAFKRELLATVDGTTIRFTGWQLDQSDLDVWETIIHLARFQETGSQVEFTAHSLLKALGRGNGKAQHEWLKDVFARLAGAVTEITSGDFTFFGALLKGQRHEKTGRYVIKIDPELLALYQAGWTQIDWGERTLLRRKPLALWLHGWFCSHANPYPIKVETIQRLSGSQNKSTKAFQQRLCLALDDLVKTSVIGSWEIRGDLVCVV